MEMITYFGRPVKLPENLSPEKRERIVAIMREKEQTGQRAFFDDEVDWDCHDCGIDTQDSNYYMVTHDLWDTHGAGESMLCVACLEKRIGRALVIDDFIDCPVNRDFLINRFDFLPGNR